MKKFKTRRKKKKNTLLIAIVSVFLLLLFIYLSTRKLNNSYNTFINFLLKEQKIIQSEDSLFKKLATNLDFLLKNYYFKEENINNELVYKEEKMNHVVYIYNTHDDESYGDVSITKVNEKLKEKLANYKIASIIETRSVSSYLRDNSLQYKESYDVSRLFLEEARNKYKNLEYFIDIHRDSVKKDITTVMINGKKYARIMFVLGLENPNYLENKVFMEQLNTYLERNYSGISRGIYEKEGSKVNGVYNQDVDSHVILIEVGGFENNFEEVLNSTELIAEALYYVIGDNNA